MTDIRTVAFAARRGTDLVWYSENGYAAHLMSDDDTSLCGYNIRLPEEAPAWHNRCGNCKAKLRKLLDAALEPSPAFVRERVTITVTRPVKENLEPLVTVLQRKVRNNTSWTVEFEEIDKVVIQPEPEEQP